MTTEQKAPAEIDDVEELRRAIRMAILDNDHERQVKLELRYQQWCIDHADQIEATRQQRQERDAQEIAEQAAADRLSKYARDNGDWEASLVTQNRFEDNRKAEAKYVDVDWARQRAEFENEKTKEAAAQRDRDIQEHLRETPFEKTPLAGLETGTPADLARVLGRSKNHITQTANDMKLVKTKGRWVFDRAQMKRLYDRLAPKTKGASYTSQRHKRKSL